MNTQREVEDDQPVINLASAKPAAQVMTSDEVFRDMDRAEAEGSVITPASAVLIASWYQSPGPIGHVLAALASGVDVGRHDVLEDIHNTRYRLRGSQRVRAEHRRELDLLAAFIHHYQ